MKSKERSLTTQHPAVQPADRSRQTKDGVRSFSGRHPESQGGLAFRVLGSGSARFKVFMTWVRSSATPTNMTRLPGSDCKAML